MTEVNTIKTTKRKNLFNDMNASPIDLLKETTDEETFEKLMDYASTSGLTSAPAVKEKSIKQCGLWQQSIYAAKLLHSFTHQNHLQWENQRSPYLIGLFQASAIAEECKYDEILGIWTFGETRKSVADIIGNIIPLTLEETECLTYCRANDMAVIMAAARKYKNVLWATHACSLAFL